ncbi:hypothetical protein BRADI_1g47025v3 [Brachypodium distachyon]|uniref:Uncharacterized protein n=1 Tax=Brachypodium distachyon TaxID=15368 RepID=A0A0Q3L7T1_BRADI|nr:hypothetical protein BRADI_1g47025v3 [Brachypodium distachyon]
MSMHREDEGSPLYPVRRLPFRYMDCLASAIKAAGCGASRRGTPPWFALSYLRNAISLGGRYRSDHVRSLRRWLSPRL